MDNHEKRITKALEDNRKRIIESNKQKTINRIKKEILKGKY